jgi:hypothetical protein
MAKLRFHLTSAPLVCALIAGVADNSLAGVRLRHLGHASFEWITPAGVLSRTKPACRAVSA